MNELDASVLADNWLRTGDGKWALGDFNGDNNVNDLDAVIMAANWGYDTNSESTAIPEPGGLAMLVGIFLMRLLSCFGKWLRTYRR